jgi:hypothetical protein
VYDRRKMKHFLAHWPIGDTAPACCCEMLILSKTTSPNNPTAATAANAMIAIVLLFITYGIYGNRLSAFGEVMRPIKSDMS